jgi:hypothetical protein
MLIIISVCFRWIGVRSRDFEREQNSKAVEQHANLLYEECEKMRRFGCQLSVVGCRLSVDCSALIKGPELGAKIPDSSRLLIPSSLSLIEYRSTISASYGSYSIWHCTNGPINLLQCCFIPFLLDCLV